MHCDQNDYSCYFTNIEELRDAGLLGGALVADVHPGEVVVCQQLALKYPAHVQYEVCLARIPIPKVISQHTVTQLPQRVGEVRITHNMFTVLTAHNRPHYVTRVHR